MAVFPVCETLVRVRVGLVARRSRGVGPKVRTIANPGKLHHKQFDFGAHGQASQNEVKFSSRKISNIPAILRTTEEALTSLRNSAKR